MLPSIYIHSTCRKCERGFTPSALCCYWKVLPRLKGLLDHIGELKKTFYVFILLLLFTLLSYASFHIPLPSPALSSPPTPQHVSWRTREFSVESCYLWMGIDAGVRVAYWKRFSNGHSTNHAALLFLLLLLMCFLYKKYLSEMHMNSERKRIRKYLIKLLEPNSGNRYIMALTRICVVIKNGQLLSVCSNWLLFIIYWIVMEM